MSWVAAGIAAAGAVKGGIDASANRKKARENDAFRKTAIAMSPWTGMGDPGAGNAGNTDTFSSMLGGGMTGASIGLMGKSGGLWGGADKAAAGATGAVPEVGVGFGEGTKVGGVLGAPMGPGSAGSMGGLYNDVKKLNPQDPFSMNKMMGMNQLPS